MSTRTKVEPAGYESLRPSEVFARRLRETRKARNLTQGQLAEMLTKAGVPMSKTALLGIEGGKRGLSLDEALAITAELNAVPTHMLLPPEGVFVQIDDNFGTDSRGFREFLRYGFPWNLDAVPYEYLPDEEREKFQLQLARLALTLGDAYRAANGDAIKEAVEKIIEEVRLREAELARERAGASPG